MHVGGVVGCRVGSSFCLLTAVVLTATVVAPPLSSVVGAPAAAVVAAVVGAPAAAVVTAATHPDVPPSVPAVVESPLAVAKMASSLVPMLLPSPS